MRQNTRFPVAAAARSWSAGRSGGRVGRSTLERVPRLAVIALLFASVPATAGTPPALREAAGVDPALTTGFVSTPYGGAFEWQYYATKSDCVPEAVRAAARRITIAVVDTGVDAGVPDLAGSVVASYDIRTHSRWAPDRDGHGTFVASLAAGTVGAGVAGFGGDARILAVKVSDNGSFTGADAAAGIRYAVDRGADIVNVSLAGQVRSAAEADALAYASRHGVLVVAAAGNDALAGNPPEYPAALLQAKNGGIAVAASDFSGRRAAFSESGSYVSLAAPGENVFGAVSSASSTRTFPRTVLPGSTTGLFGYASGTSFAAAEVAGAAALVWAANARLSAAQVVDVLEQTATGGQWSPELGYGVIDVAAAVARASAH